jgi:hypothetical protein
MQHVFGEKQDRTEYETIIKQVFAIDDFFVNC